MKTLKKLWLAFAMVLGSSIVTAPVHAFEITNDRICFVSNVALGFVVNMLPKGTVDELSAAILFAGLNLAALEKANIVSIPAYIVGKIAASVTKRVAYGEEQERRGVTPKQVQ